MSKAGAKIQSEFSNPASGTGTKATHGQTGEKPGEGSFNASGVGSLVVATLTSRGRELSPGFCRKKKADHEKLNDERGESPCQ